MSMHGLGRCEMPNSPRGAEITTVPSSRRPVGRALRPRLKVVIITEDDPLYVIRFFDVLFAEYPRNEIDLCGITVDRAFHEPLVRTLKRLSGCYGFWGVGRLGLRYLGAKARGRSIEMQAARFGVPVIATRSVNDPEYIERLRALAPDVIVSVAAPEVFQPTLLSLPRLGCVNIHSGRLPAYRGMMPTFWQMRNGEPEATITVHRMGPRLDAGDILATRTFPIRERDKLDRVIKGTKASGARLVIDVLRALGAGEARARPPEQHGAAYYSFPRRADVRAFHKCGHKLL